MTRAATGETSLTRRLPTSTEIECASSALAALKNAMAEDGAVLVSAQGGNPVRVEPAIGALLVELLGHVAAGRTVRLERVTPLLTPSQAAEMLNISRPGLNELLYGGEIPFVETRGGERRIPFGSLIEYREANDARREAALDELARLGQEFDTPEMSE